MVGKILSGTIWISLNSCQIDSSVESKMVHNRRGLTVSPMMLFQRISEKILVFPYRSFCILFVTSSQSFQTSFLKERPDSFKVANCLHLGPIDFRDITELLMSVGLLKMRKFIDKIAQIETGYKDQHGGAHKTLHQSVIVSRKDHFSDSLRDRHCLKILLCLGSDSHLVRISPKYSFYLRI